MIIEEGWLAAIGSYQVIVLTLGAVVFMGVMLSTKRRLRRYRQTTKLPTRDNAGQVARDVEDVMAELDELARQINGRLDTRFTKLEAALRDADERIDQLQRLVRQSGGEPGLDVTVGNEPSSAIAAPPISRHANIYALAEKGRTAVEIAGELNQPAGEVELILALRRAKSRVDVASNPIRR